MGPIGKMERGSVSECSGKMGNSFNLRFRLDARRNFFTARLVRHWNRLHSEVVDALSLAVFKATLDGTLSNLISWKVSLHMAG